MSASWISLYPVMSRSSSPTLSVMPTPAQSASCEHRLVTLSQGEGRTTVPLPRSEQPAACGPHWPLLLMGEWHWVLPPPHLAQSESSKQLPLPSCPHLSTHTPCGEQILPEGHAYVAEHWPHFP